MATDFWLRIAQKSYWNSVVNSCSHTQITIWYLLLCPRTWSVSSPILTLSADYLDFLKKSDDNFLILSPPNLPTHFTFTRILLFTPVSMDELSWFNCHLNGIPPFLMHSVLALVINFIFLLCWLIIPISIYTFCNTPTLEKKKTSLSNIPLQPSPFMEKNLSKELFLSRSFLTVFYNQAFNPTILLKGLFSGSPVTSRLLTLVAKSQAPFYLMAPVDTVNYHLLYRRLFIHGFHATTPFRFSFYLNSFSFNLVSWFSFFLFPRNVGVLQLYDLGPHLSLIYTYSVGDLIQSYGFKYCINVQTSSFKFSSDFCSAVQ